MPGPSAVAQGRVSDRFTRKHVFIGLLSLLMLIAAGHIYLIEPLASIHFGLPLWIWVQLGILAIMMLIAWYAVAIYTVGIEASE